ncbi:MAG: hypothetical protein GC155_13660 [Alphaproteobacteria bacterium]|nr:hypothetical protein [Alphaproteobacteria bacterium]
MTLSSHAFHLRGLACAALAVGFGGLAGCASNPDKPPPELSNEQVCLDHFDRDPVERDRCHQTVEQRRAGTTDLDPHQLPVKTDEGH